jgi:hypothetical protein
VIATDGLRQGCTNPGCLVARATEFFLYRGTCGSVVVKALRCKSEGPGIDSRCRRVFFPWHLTVPCALGSTQPLKMSTSLILGVKAAGA